MCLLNLNKENPAESLKPLPNKPGKKVVSRKSRTLNSEVVKK